jgi:ABC-2 type transport system ATP-binding protein
MIVIALILALITKPDLILLDEPTRGLDPLLRSTLHTILKDYQKSGGTILLSSHDLSEVEELCTNLAIIKDGNLVTDNSLEELKKSRTHKVKVTFSSKVPNLDKLGVNNLVKTGKTLNFNLKGSLDPLIEDLSKHKVKDLEITSASLEDIFMEIYS